MQFFTGHFLGGRSAIMQESCRTCHRDVPILLQDSMVAKEAMAEAMVPRFFTPPNFMSFL